jgi:hypothetical protein
MSTCSHHSSRLREASATGQVISLPQGRGGIFISYRREHTAGDAALFMIASAIILAKTVFSWMLTLLDSARTSLPQLENPWLKVASCLN